MASRGLGRFPSPKQSFAGRALEWGPPSLREATPEAPAGAEPLTAAANRPDLAPDLVAGTFFGSPRYSCRMATDTPPPDAVAPRDRWQLFEALAGERVRASDVAWAGALSPAQRLAVADDLLVTVRDVRLAAGDWQEIDDRAWEATLAARIHDVAAFRRLDEANLGSSPLANPG